MYIGIRALVAVGLVLWTGAVQAQSIAEQPPAPAAPEGEASEGGLTGDLTREPLHRTADGTMVPMPEIASLDCPGMETVLRRIDRTGYRGPDPVPEGDPDRPLFEYEHALTARYYEECLASRETPPDPGSTFLRGLWSE